jgi:glycosyltransferase involved in cell wall biosynthesis
VRICIIGKYPPIQGGVSARTYWSAHGLAARGHEIHVVTNAKEVRPPFRMHMRAEDWRRCEGNYGSGSVTVHWTDPVDRSQSYIPMASPFVSKLAATAAQAHSEHPFDVIFSFYMEPYGVAGHLAAQMTGVPHVTRMAGSDAGRLWHHPQLEALYDHVLRSAELVILSGAVAERAVERGVAAERIAAGGGFSVPEDLFNPDGPALDLAAMRIEAGADPDLRDLLWGEFSGGSPYFGFCGKLGEQKGSFPLLAAMHRLKRAGMDIGLVGLAHGPPTVEDAFRIRARVLGLVDRILLLPFLPHWRMPEFLRGCLAVCCLEQDFPIVFHSPIIPREVLLCGSCLVASTELIKKLPGYGRLPDGYGCVAIENVNDLDTLSDRLAAIVEDSGPAAAVGARGCIFARELQRNVRFPRRLEHILEAAASRKPVSSSLGEHADTETGDARFQLTQLAAAALAEAESDSGNDETRLLPKDIADLAGARHVLAVLERSISDGRLDLRPLVPAVQVEIAVAAAESEADDANLTERGDPLFRLRIRRWAIEDGDLAGLVPVRDPKVRILKFDYDVSAFQRARTVADLPAAPIRRPSYIVAFARAGDGPSSPLLVDRLTARTLELSDGTRAAAEIAKTLNCECDTNSTEDALGWIENLFVRGLLWLYDEPQANQISAGL